MTKSNIKLTRVALQIEAGELRELKGWLVQLMININRRRRQKKRVLLWDLDNKLLKYYAVGELSEEKKSWVRRLKKKGILSVVSDFL